MSAVASRRQNFLPNSCHSTPGPIHACICLLTTLSGDWSWPGKAGLLL